jgi:ferrous iron transport protein A
MRNSYLASLQPQQIATISHLEPETGFNQRLQALGFRVGQQVVMLRKAWFSGPVHVRVGMTEVILRRQEAQKIAVTNITAGVRSQEFSSSPRSHTLYGNES